MTTCTTHTHPLFKTTTIRELMQAFEHSRWMVIRSTSTSGVKITTSVSLASTCPVVKASASRPDDPGFDSRLRCGDFSGSRRISDFRAVYRPIGLVVKAFASRAADLGSITAFSTDLFPGRVIAET